MRDLIVKKGIPYAALVCALILGWNWAFPESDAKAKLAAIRAQSHAAMMAIPGERERADKRCQKDVLLRRMVETGAISVMEAKALSDRLDIEISKGT